MSLSELEQRIDYTFKQPQLLLQAITHASFSADHNERLEFLGDSVLSAVMADHLFTLYPDVSEGVLTKLRSSLVSGVALSSLASELSIGPFLRLGKGEELSQGRQRPSILENQLEAIVGAIFLDSNWEVTRAVVLKWFDSRLNTLNINETVNFKSALQEWLQANNHPLPKYELKERLGEEHAQEFVMECRVDSLKLSAQGQASSRKKSEQKAAEIIYKEILKNHG
ncbi:MAG: ribonuclease III [Pseudomonadota bacterium]